ncbi:MAG: protein phosphatase 2C domain-containing protein [Saprospiraceae bacterium]
MTRYEITQIGEHHTNYCEDYVLTTSLGEDQILCAVMDGCTMATESYFASTLIGKILRKVAKEISYKSFLEKEEIAVEVLLKKIVAQLFNELKHLKNILFLEKEELLSTLLIGVVDKKNQSGEFLAIGDGMFCIDGKITEFEQDNKPDYFGYHLDEDFEEWYASQNQKISAQKIQDLSICTDGIFTFQKFDNQKYQSSENVIDFLLKNKDGFENQNMIRKKIFEIEKNWGLKPTDDLGIIRLIF